MKSKRFIYILSFLIVLTLVFIWGHSIVPAAVSADESKLVGNWITPMLELFVGKGNVTDHIVRKLAHFCEFFVLGSMIMMLISSFEKITFLRVSYGVLCTLAVGVIDETIQLAAEGRGARVSDILLDFSGAVTGITVVLIICLIVRKVREKKQCR